jgi:hypothetical protein
MSIEEFIIAVFCLIDDELKNLLKGRRLRARGPTPVCKFARAHFSKIFKGIAAYGYCAAKQEKYYGLRKLLRNNHHRHVYRRQYRSDFVP